MNCAQRGRGNTCAHVRDPPTPDPPSRASESHRFIYILVCSKDRALLKNPVITPNPPALKPNPDPPPPIFFGQLPSTRRSGNTPRRWYLDMRSTRGSILRRTLYDLFGRGGVSLSLRHPFSPLLTSPYTVIQHACSLKPDAAPDARYKN